ncbi:hypothetical protein Tco_1296613 [Tanacetum coccineum]
MAGSIDENPPPPPLPPPPQIPTQQAPHIVSTIKLPILKKGEYDIWAMKMEYYLSHTDYPIWEVIQKGNGPMWDAIKSKFGGNDESKKMQFQSLLSQLEIHGAGVSTEDANQKFLRSLPSSWSQVSLVMRTKPGVDSLSFDDLYNNLRVFESDVKGSTGSSSSAQNVAFVSSKSTSSTNDVSTAYGVSTSSDLEQLDEFDLEEMDLKWQVAMILIRLKKFYKKTDQKEFKIAKEEMQEPKVLVTLNGEGVDWTGHVDDEQENFALMAYSNSGSDTKVTSCSKECVESYAKLKKLYDEQREQLSDASIEIQAYTQALKMVEAQLVAHQKNQLWYEEKIRFMKIDLDDKTDVLTYHKKLLAEAISTKDKSGLGYGNQVHEGVLSYENEVFQSVFDSRSSDVEDSYVHDRFANVEGMHAVPPLMIGNYMPSGPDSMFTCGPKQSKTSESDT